MLRAARIVLINLLLFLVLAVIAELAFGGWVFHENYGTLVIPKNFSRVFDTDDLYGGGKIKYIRDRYGLRGDYGDPSSIDILTIGGSTTNEIFVGEGQTWSDVLGAELSRRLGRRVRVANAGVDGQSTVGNLKDFDLWFPKIPNLKPRYVLLYLGINDSTVIMTGTTNSKQDQLVHPYNATKQYLMNNSAIYALFRNIRGMIRARNAKMIHGSRSMLTADFAPLAEKPDLAEVAQRYAAGLDAYGDRLRELARRIRAMGAEPIFVDQNAGDYRIDADGTLWGALDEEGRPDPGHYAILMVDGRRTMEVCRELKAICVDLVNTLRFTVGDQYDMFHSTPQGSAKIGKALAAALADKLKF